VWEWNETVVSSSSRGLPGGAWSSFESDMQASHRDSDDPSLPTPFYGFRVVSAVPEPSALGLIMLGGAMWLLKRRRSH